jgi:hypothetical protein
MIATTIMISISVNAVAARRAPEADRFAKCVFIFGFSDWQTGTAVRREFVELLFKNPPREKVSRQLFARTEGSLR